MEISSTKNPQIKHIKQLQSKSKLRIKEDAFVVEGVREVQLALSSNFNFKKVFISEEHYSGAHEFSEGTEIVTISSKVYEYLAYRSSTEGIIGLCKCNSRKLENLKFKNAQPLVLVIESPEKPGNIGAIFRTADAAGVDAVIIANPRTDLYNPNTIRSSLGAVFSNQIATGASNEVYSFLVNQKFQIYAATLQNSNSYLEHDYCSPTAFVMGSEAHGLTEVWRNKKNIKAITIPMRGQIDSMNLSVSTAILTFEALRQRG